MRNIINATIEDDIAGDFSTTATIMTGEFLTSSIEQNGDSDFIAIDIAAGQTLDFTLDANFFRQTVLVDSDGNIVAQPSRVFRAPSNSPEASFQFQAEEAGTFFYTVLGVEDPNLPGDNGAGEYTLTVTEIDDDVGNFTSSATAIQGDENIINGSFEYFSDRDAYTIELSEGETLNVTIEDGLAAAEIAILGPDGLVPDNLIALDFITTRFGRFDLSLEVEALETGTYTIIAANDFDGFVDFNSRLAGTGDYTLTTSITESITDGDNDINTIQGTNSNDVLRGTNGDDDIFGQDGNDILRGENGQDVLFGDTGNDRLFGGDQDDSLFGEAGNDRLFGDDGNDFLTGGNGNDQLSGGNGEDDLFGDGGRDIIRGGSGDDFINGGDGRDRLFGNNGDDNLVGDDGNDRLDGGSGNDLLTGGNGRDTFVHSDNSGFDRIEDFQSGRDVIDLSRSDFDDFNDLTLVEQNDTVFVFISENASIELTGINDLNDITADDFVF